MVIFMSFDRYDVGLNQLATCSFDRAIRELEKENKHKNENTSYYYAVAKLGALLTNIVGYKKFSSIDYEKPLIEKTYSDLLLSSYNKNQDAKLTSIEVKEETAENLSAIIPLFDLAKKNAKQKNIEGINNALSLINQLLQINKMDGKQRNELFYIELKRFQVSYTTKLHVCSELSLFEQDYTFQYFIPQPVKQLRLILNANKHDVLYISPDQINALYSEYNKYHYNKKYHDIFLCLEKSIILFHKYMYEKNRNNYTDIWNMYHGVINIEKVIFIHSIYTNKQLENLHIFIEELNKNKILDKSIPSLKQMVSCSNFSLNELKNITQIILDNPLDSIHINRMDNQKTLLTRLFRFALEEIPKKQHSEKYLREYISHINTTCIMDCKQIDVPKINLYLELWTVFSDNTSQQEQICNLIKETAITIGEKHFTALCEKILHYKIVSTDAIKLMNVALQLDNNTMTDLLHLIDSYHNNFHALEMEVNDIIIKAFQLKYPEKPLEEVIHDFRTISNDVEYPIGDEELNQLTENYIKLKKIGDQLLTKNNVELQKEIEELKRELSFGAIDEDAQELKKGLSFDLKYENVRELKKELSFGAIDEDEQELKKGLSFDLKYENVRELKKELNFGIIDRDEQELKTELNFVVKDEDEQELKKELNVGVKDKKLKLLAIIRLKIKETLHINPYNIQMINLLALINQPRRIAQIKTGEGKSTLIAMLAAYYGFINYTVDIATTTDDLAIRDAMKFELFYRSLGLTVSHNINRKNKEVYEKNIIVYGTVHEFEFAYLRGETQFELEFADLGGETQNGMHGRGSRLYGVAIVDEVDGLFIDAHGNQAITSQASEKGYPPVVYQTIWNWIENTEKKEQTKENLQSKLKLTGINIDLDLATTWLKSAHTAQIYTLNKEYIIDVPDGKSNKKNVKRIKIVDKRNTGQISKETTRWQGGLHQILEAKHHLDIQVESLMTGCINHIEYFNKYNILMGLSGTLGSKFCRDALLRLYKVTTYDSPPYKPSLKEQIPHLIEHDEKAQIAAVKKIAQTMSEQGRPALILCEDIQESQKYKQYLSKDNKSIQLYNGIQGLSAETILGLAGNPGSKTVATNCAGRGADIVTTPDAESKGGLHVILTFPAINMRVEKQAFGRTGRQGKKGTYHYVLREDQLTASEKKGETIEEKISLMHSRREEMEENILRNNMFNHDILHKLFIIQTIFFGLPIKIKEKHMTEWAKYKTESSKYATQCMHDELEEENDDVVMRNILGKFTKFWKNNISKYGNEYKTPLIFIETVLRELIHSNQLSVDEYRKKALIEILIFLNDPAFHFSSELTDLMIDFKGSQLLESLSAPEKTFSFNLSGWLPFSLPNTWSKLSPPDKKINDMNGITANYSNPLSLLSHK